MSGTTRGNREMAVATRANRAKNLGGGGEPIPFSRYRRPPTPTSHAKIYNGEFILRRKPPQFPERSILDSAKDFEKVNICQIENRLLA